MSLIYNQINLSVNGFYLLAETVNINENSPQKAIFSFNNKSPYNIVPTNINNQISINYFMEPGNEPNYSTITGILFDRTNARPSIINIGNTFITGYISNYSFSLTQNSLVKISTSFNVYYNFTGNLIAENSGDYLFYNTGSGSTLAHYWSASFYSGNNINSNNNIIELQYSAQLTNQPLYGIGDPFPKQIYLDAIEESLNIVGEQQYNTNFSGQLFDNLIPNSQILVLQQISNSQYNNYSNLPTGFISIPLTGMTLQQMKSDISTDNVVFFNTLFNRFS